MVLYWCAFCLFIEWFVGLTIISQFMLFSLSSLCIVWCIFLIFKSFFGLFLFYTVLRIAKKNENRKSSLRKKRLQLRVFFINSQHGEYVRLTFSRKSWRSCGCHPGDKMVYHPSYILWYNVVHISTIMFTFSWKPRNMAANMLVLRAHSFD